MIKRYFLTLLCLFSMLVFNYAQSELSLNGEWQIIFDEKNEGRKTNWMQSEVFEQNAHKQTIQVPSAWELIKQDYEGVAFYKKEFKVPADWENKVIRLQFGAVNYLSEVWLNGEVVGFHEGGFTPFEFRVDEMIKVGEENTLILRVVGPITLTDNEIDGIGQMETAQWRGGLTGGIWQDVKLVATGAIYVDNVFIQPNISNNTATFQTELDHTGIKESNISLTINITETTNPSKIITTFKENWSLHPGKNKKSHILKIADAKYWSPDNPHLYLAEIILHNGENVSDSWEERFGMRQLTIKDKNFYLNGKRIFIKASFFEGLYPNGIANPDSEAMARREIQLAKDAGFNMIRPWRRPPVPMWLDLADEMGVLVVGSPALECMTLPVSTPYLPTRVEHEVRQSILRDRNRACIVQWELFNELHRPVLKQLMHPMAMLARSLDPTRLILDESGGWAFGANMYLPNEYEPTQFNDIHNYPGPFINQFRYDGYLSVGLTEEEITAKGYKGSKVGRNVVPHLMSYVSELGYGSLPDLTVNNAQFKKEGNPLTPAYRYHARLHKEQQQMLKATSFDYLYPNMQQFYLDEQKIHGTANKRMIEAVRANPEVDGYCIHALSAGDWILGAGLIDLWRNPKSYAYEATKAANQPRIVSIRLFPRNIYADEGAKLEITGINDLAAVAAKIAIEIIDKKGKTVFQKVVDNNWASGVATLFESNLSTKKWSGNYSVNVRVVGTDGQLLTENSYPFDVFKSKATRLPKAKISVIDTDHPLSTFVKSQTINVTEFSESTSLVTPVFVTHKKELAETDQQQLTQLFDFVKKGGTAIYIEGIKEDVATPSSIMPFQVNVHPAKGLWTCIPHLIRKHPIFEGLPADTPMRAIYENVWATRTLRDLTIEDNQATNPIIASIGFDWFSREHKLHYSGPGASWWGSDLVEMPYGKGRIIISQLELVKYLGKDPVADKILGNMIRYLGKK